VPKANESVKGLGAKYGGTLRKRYARVWRTLKQARECPACASLKLARASSGIWKCKSCGYTVAGGAYELAQAKAR
jgi:large subunit ribosomal protein L37Ae